jgi:uncharacterized membrane protein
LWTTEQRTRTDQQEKHSYRNNCNRSAVHAFSLAEGLGRAFLLLLLLLVLLLLLLLLLLVLLLLQMSTCLLLLAAASRPLIVLGG